VGSSPLRRLSSPVCLAVGVVAVHLVLACIWVLQHDLPTGGRDEFFIVEVTTDIAYRMGPGSWDAIGPYYFENAYYPPLVRLPGIAALALGGGYRALVFSGWVWLPFLLIPTWLIGRQVSGTPWGGTGAVALLLAAPGLADSLHHYESNLGPMAMGACCFWAWLHSQHFTRYRYALVFGLFLGVGLLSDRLGLLPFVGIPCLASLLMTRSKETLRGLALMAMAAVLTAGWWYLGFFERFGAELLPQLTQGEINRAGSLIEERPPFVGRWGHYLLLWPDSQMGFVGGTLALLGLGLAGLRRRQKDFGALLVWVVGGLLLFTLSQKRQVYYTLPLLPLAAVLANSILVQISRRGRRAGTAVAVILLALSQLPGFLSLRPDLADISPGLRTWLLLNQSPISEEFLGDRHPIGRSPAPSGLNLDAAVAQVREATGKAQPSLAVFSADNAQVTEHYQVVLGRIALKGLDVRGLTTHPEGFLQGNTPPDALLFVHRGGDHWPDRQRLVAAHESHDQWHASFEGLATRLEQWRSTATLLGVQPLDDGEELSIWRLGP